MTTDVERQAHRPAVELEGVGKRYWKLAEPAMLLRSLLPLRRPGRSELWAVRDLDLAVGDGETVGILGRNGAGKTTILRLLAGVTRPTTGVVRMTGRVAPLIGVGVGFHPEMTGRENVFVNGMLLGLTREELRDRFDDIVAFAELADFIDTPVKFYSSGMFLRLGFAVAIHVDPSVLLIDEVLAVGDYAFQLKCLDRMRLLQSSGTTIVIVTHSQEAVRLLCPRAVVISHGRLQFDGDVTEAIATHHRLLASDDAGRAISPDTEPVRILRRELLGPDGPVTAVVQHSKLCFRASLRFEIDVESPQVFFTVATEEGSAAYHLIPRIGEHYRHFRAGEVVDLEATFDAHLAGGTYRLGFSVFDNLARDLLYEDQVGFPMYVSLRLGAVGVAELDGVVSVGGIVITDHQERTLGRAPATEDPPGEPAS